MFDYLSKIQKIRADFPFFSTELSEKFVYLDNAATTLKPYCVLESINKYYTEYPFTVHRSVYDEGFLVSSLYEESRAKIANFLGVLDPEEILFTAGTTAGINHFAKSFADAFFEEGDRIIITEMEHHSNILPWQKIAKEYKCILDYLPLNKDGTLNLSCLQELLKKPTKLLAMTALSNSLGEINPVEDISRMCKELGIYFFLDAAQSISHIPYSLSKSNIDFFVFSGHKLFAETGIGVLWGRKDLLKKMPPFFLGGGIVYDVSMDKAFFAGVPAKFEAGTPAVAQAISLSSAVDYFLSVGWDTIQKIDAYHLKRGQAITEKFSSYLKFFGQSSHKAPIFSFIVNQVHSHDVGSFFNEFHIGVRTGHHCTQPLWKALGVDSTTRISPSLYNLPSDWDKVEDVLEKLLEFFHVRKFV